MPPSFRGVMRNEVIHEEALGIQELGEQPETKVLLVHLPISGQLCSPQAEMTQGSGSLPVCGVTLSEGFLLEELASPAPCLMRGARPDP